MNWRLTPIRAAIDLIHQEEHVKIKTKVKAGPILINATIGDGG